MHDFGNYNGYYPQMITVKPQVAQAQNIKEHWHCSFEM